MRKEIIIPENKSDIKLKDYLKFEKLTLVDNEEDFLNHKILEIFYNISYDEFRGMNPKDYEDIMVAINKALQTKSNLKQIITIENKEYGLIPKFDEITTGELIDLDNFLKQKDYFSLLSILYRPIVERKKDKYLIEEYKGVNPEVFENIDVETFEGCMGFFLDLLKNLEKAIQKYLEILLNTVKKNQKMKIQEEQLKSFHQNLNLVISGLPTFNFFGNYLQEIY
jgi:hypothetical protein